MEQVTELGRRGQFASRRCLIDGSAKVEVPKRPRLSGSILKCGADGSPLSGGLDCFGGLMTKSTAQIEIVADVVAVSVAACDHRMRMLLLLLRRLGCEFPEGGVVELLDDLELTGNRHPPERRKKGTFNS